MSLPPNVIAVKRKRGDEPLDLLYVQTESAGSREASNGKRRVTDVVPGTYRFVRLQDGNEDRNKLAPLPQSNRAASTSLVRENQSAAGTNSSLKPQDALFQAPNLTSTPPSPSKLRNGTTKRSASPRPGRELRRFLLTKERLGSSPSGRSSPQNGVQKRKAAARGGMAVFSEQKQSMLRSVASINDIRPDTEDATSRKQEPTERHLKRPGATATERRWRAENWQARSPRSDRSVSPMPGSDAASRQKLSMDEMESLRLAAQLQQFAMETTAAPTREEHPMPPLDAMDVDQGDEEDESEWVYDRYIRHKEVDSHTASASDMEMINSEGGFTKQTAVPGGSSGAVGLLVIREEDKADWEAFGQEDVDSDENRYSEDEDSNAEDFYANDYPEAELSSDDEFDAPGAAYRAKKVVTSDNEYDLANDAWSDDDSYGFSSADEAFRGSVAPWRTGKPRRVERMVDAGEESA